MAAPLSATPGLADTVAPGGKHVEILRVSEKLGDTMVHFAPDAPDAAVTCYAFDHKGEVLGHQPGFTAMRSIRMYDIPRASVGEVICERQD